MPLRAAWNDYVHAMGSFSRPARQFLMSTFFTWAGHGAAQVVFNLYLVSSGFRESFVGQAVSFNAAGLAAMALPAGVLADRWGRRRTLVLGALLEGAGMAVRAASGSAPIILGSSFVAGCGAALLAIAAAPFLTEHSTPRERTHLFSTFFAVELLAAVVGSFAGGAIPHLLLGLQAFVPDLAHAYRLTLWLGAAVGAVAALPIIATPDAPRVREAPAGGTRATFDLLAPIAVTFFLMGAGAGLVIPFMNLYFSGRFQCSSTQIGTFFSIAQLVTAAAAMSGPVFARRFGALRTCVGLQLLSLPFLVTLGLERQLDVAVVVFVVRAALMQASSPLMLTFVMEALPGSLRARATSVNNLVWNIGWAVSATLAGVVIERFGYAVPFYFTATLYAISTLHFYRVFRRRETTAARPAVSAEALAHTGTDPLGE